MAIRQVEFEVGIILAAAQRSSGRWHRTRLWSLEPVEMLVSAIAGDSLRVL